MARRLIVALLLVVGVGTAALAVGRAGSSSSSGPPLDEPAVAACRFFGPQAGAVRDGSLVGQPLYRLLQDTYDSARLSRTPGFAERVATLYQSAMSLDAAALRRDVLGLQLVCRPALR